VGPGERKVQRSGPPEEGDAVRSWFSKGKEKKNTGLDSRRVGAATEKKGKKKVKEFRKRREEGEKKEGQVELVHDDGRALGGPYRIARKEKEEINRKRRKERESRGPPNQGRQECGSPGGGGGQMVTFREQGEKERPMGEQHQKENP